MQSLGKVIHYMSNYQRYFFSFHFHLGKVNVTFHMY